MRVVEPGSLSEFIWNEKYRFKKPDGTPIDQTIEDTFSRVAAAVAATEADHLQSPWCVEFFNAMKDFEFLPAGRIIAGAGTGRLVTLNNCYVMGDIQDSLEGIMHANAESAMTMKQGGGIGMNFSTLRPRGALVKGVDSFSSGAVSFMDLWNSMCGTIMSAGSRRGAMMGTLRVDHPDIEEFITVKQAAGKLTNFNISVLVTEAFMVAVELNSLWHLKFEDKVYKTVRARELWEKILRSTYEYAEPGVIFIDAVNSRNPLWDIENITATNPCGEMPLPPYGACVLGSINLARLVEHPFSDHAAINYKRLAQLTSVATRFLDNVVDVSAYPLRQQQQEAKNKRRIGLGITGLADALIMLGISYRSTDAHNLTSRIMRDLAFYSLETSRELADEKGHYPLWNEATHGARRRNSHLLSIAPTGTISCFAGNVSSGIEPVFDFEYFRNVLLPDGSKKQVRCVDYASRLFTNIHDRQPDESRDIWVTATELTPREHIAVAAAAQQHVDSAVSKTINCAPDMPFDDFAAVYDQAHKAGMKGCTTYRPSGVRGAVLEKDAPKEAPKAVEKPEPAQSNVVSLTKPLKRPAVLLGTTYKIERGVGAAIYVTINNLEINGQQRPFEIFFNSKAVECQAWMISLSRMISAVFRKGGDVSFIVEELTSIHDPEGGYWDQGKYVPSLPAAIGRVIEQHLSTLGGEESRPEPQEAAPAKVQGKVCPKCSAGLLIRREGCWGCDSCTYSKC
jgi:ribonucleoside-diphosphate reductase alpha chain